MRHVFLLAILLTGVRSCIYAQQQSKLDAVTLQQIMATISSNYFNPEKIGVLQYNIQFKVKPGNAEERKTFKGTLMPWINIDSPETELSRLVKPDDVVIKLQNVELIIDYPLRKFVNIPISSTDKGFTRRQLILIISKEYHRLYNEEEGTSTIKTLPAKDRPIMNRNETDGKYGIWGHDIKDLDLSSIEVYKKKDGTYFLYLIVES